MEHENKNFSPGRRQFFINAALAGIAAGTLPFWLTSCSDTGETQTIDGQAPFNVWAEMVEVLKTSPDNLVARKNKLITSADPEAMLQFVRDEIILIPARPGSIGALSRELKWGVRQALRCGMATAREKAEILADMLQSAGFEAKIVLEDSKFEESEIPDLFLRSYNREFAPEISKKQIKRWSELMGQPVDIDEAARSYQGDADQLVKSLKQTFEDPSANAKNFKFKWSNRDTPAIEFKSGEQVLYAHLFDPKVPFGQLRQSEKPMRDAGKPIVSNEKVSFKLFGIHSKNTRNRVLLMEAELAANDLLGRKVDLSFIKDVQLGEYSIKSKNDFQIFTPQVSLNGLGLNQSFLEERCFIGDPIKLDGEKIILNSENPDENFDAGFIQPSDPNLIKRAETIQVSTQLASFPIVKINVDVRDRDGNFIEGLQANDFVITEDGQSKRALLQSNQRTPKVLILSDASLSMPKVYRGQGMEEFNQQLEADILQNFPGAKLEFWKTPSALYSWLRKASQTDADLIIFATDGHNSDKYKESDRLTYETGAPALILDVYAEDNSKTNETFEKMAQLTGGQVIPAKDQASTRSAISNFLNQIQISPYVFTYASSSRIDRHTVVVSLDKKRLSAEDQYQFPEEVNPSNSGWVGIDLDIYFKRSRTDIRRTLAGWDRTSDYDPEDNLRHIHEVRGLLMGNTQLFMEGEGPTLSTALTEFLEAKLTNQKWGEAFISNDMKAAKEAMDAGGIYQLPGAILHLLMPPENQVSKNHLTIPTGYRTAISKFLVGFGDLPTRASFDYLPSSHYQSITRNPNKAFDQTMRVTAQFAIREAALFQQSTYSLLANKPLLSDEQFALKERKEIRQSYIDFAPSSWKFGIRPGNSIGIADSSLNTAAYWQINNQTGELYGYLPDGTGGGNTPSDGSVEMQMLMDILATVDHTVMMVTGASIFANPLAGLSLGIVAKYGLTLVRLYAMVSEALVIMDTGGLEERVQKELQIFACNVAKDILYGITGNAGKIAAGLDTLIGLMVPAEDNPFACK